MEAQTLAFNHHKVLTVPQRDQFSMRQSRYHVPIKKELRTKALKATNYLSLSHLITLLSLLELLFNISK